MPTYLCLFAYLILHLVGSSVQDYILSRVYRELACVQKFSEFPHQQGLFYGPGQYRPSKKLKTDTLHHYIKVAPFLLPNDNTISKPVLWHPDLHGDNIFVNPSQPTDILAIIDWQSVNLSPLFLQARHPALIEFDGPVTEGFQSIKLPENFDKLSPSEQLEAKKLRAAQSLYKLYEIQLIRQCPDVARALRFRDSLAGQITGLAGSIFSDGEPTLQGMLMRLRQEWPACVSPSTPCPLSFSTEDENQQKKDEAKWREGVELMEEFLGQVGAYRGWDGWVNHQNFEVMKSRLSECREDFLTRHSATDEEKRQFMKHWPFMDK